MTFSVSGSVRIDLTGAEYGRGHVRLYGLEDLPDGVRVIISVESPLIDFRVVECLQAQAERLRLEVQGDPAAVRTWVRVLRSDNPSAALYDSEVSW